MEETKNSRGEGANSSQASNLIQNFRKRLNITSLSKKIKAFTLAEVLITLAIIGVVAALTIPTVITNYQKKMYVTQLKKTYNNLSNGLRTIMGNDGVTKLSDTNLWATLPELGTDETRPPYRSNGYYEKSYKAFREEFEKTFKVIKFKESQSITYKSLKGVELGKISLETYFADGAAVQISVKKRPTEVYCPKIKRNCTSIEELKNEDNSRNKLKYWEYVGEILVDVNGTKAPNIIGRDLFIFWIGNNGVLYPLDGPTDAWFVTTLRNLELKGMPNLATTCVVNSAYSGASCSAKIMEEGWEMKY